MTTPKPNRRLEFDVGPMLARGEEPFGPIMTRVGRLQPEDELMLYSPFLPSPLIERLRARGYDAEPELRGDGSWQTLFRRH